MSRTQAHDRANTREVKIPHHESVVRNGDNQRTQTRDSSDCQRSTGTETRAADRAGKWRETVGKS